MARKNVIKEQLKSAENPGQELLVLV